MKSELEKVKEEFASRLNLAMDEQGYPVRGRARVLSKEFGVSDKGAGKWINGEAIPETSKIPLIAAFLGINAEWLLSGVGEMRPLSQTQRMGDMVQSQAGQSQGQIQGEPWKSHLMALEPWEDGDKPDPDEVDLPFFDDVSFAAGDGSFLIQVGMNAQRKLRFLRATLEAAGVRIEDAACAKNSGTSMEDLIRDGATIGIDISKAQYPIKDGKIYAMFHGGMLRIKYLYRLPGGGVRLRSHNRDEYEDEDLFGDKLNDFRVLGWVFWWSTVDRW